MPGTVPATHTPRTPSRRHDALLVLRIVGALLVWGAGAMLGGLGTLPLSSLLTPELRRGPFGTLLLVPPFLVATIALLLYVRLVDRRAMVAVGLWPDGARGKWFRGAAVGGLMMGVVALVWLTVVGGAVWRGNDDLSRAAAGLVVAFMAFLVQGPSEEVLFRGYILQSVTSRWGGWWGVGVSAAVFGALHGLNPSFGALPAINLLLFGLAAALYKLLVDGGQLWGVFAIHSVWNWLQEFVFGLENSGTATNPGNVLVQLVPDKNRPTWVWGGGFGPEGTLGATIVLTALIVAVLLEGRARSGRLRDAVRAAEAREAAAFSRPRRTSSRAPRAGTAGR